MALQVDLEEGVLYNTTTPLGDPPQPPPQARA